MAKRSHPGAGTESARRGDAEHRPGTLFHDLLYGIVAGIALTQVVDFRFWDTVKLPPDVLGVWISLFVLYLWGVVKMTVFWLGAREDFLAMREQLREIRIWEYLGGVLVAMLLGLMPLTAVMCVRELMPSTAAVAAGSFGDWQGCFLVFLVAHTLATGVSNLVVAGYVVLRLRRNPGTDGKSSAPTPSQTAIEARLRRPWTVVAVPVATSGLCWAAWLAAADAGDALAGLCSVAVLVPLGHAMEEGLLWRSRHRR